VSCELPHEPGADPATLRAADAGSADPEQADPDRISTQHDFGRELTRARLAAGLTVRQVAKRSGLAASTVGDYFAGRHLPPPSQPAALNAILAACGITGADRVGRWSAALSRARRAPGRRPAAVPAPYRGLASFQPEDAQWFFGREELTERLVALAADSRRAGLPLAVVGPSGSGKSSLLRAGLIPALRRRASAAGLAHLPVALFTPGSHPAQALTAALAEAGLAGWQAGGPAPGSGAQSSEYANPVIVADQLEEIFTVCQDEHKRRWFIAELRAMAARAVVALGLRADCYDHATASPELAEILQERQLVVTPMSVAELRRAIVEPARRAKADVSEGFVELLLRDLKPRHAAWPAQPEAAGHAVGALPLLSHALLATWELSRSGQLTIADYEASGGISDAIARTAEAAYGALDEADRLRARRLLLRLVQVSDDSVEIRHRVPLAELSESDEAGPGDQVLGRFVQDRLITLSEDTAEITHEALLAAWPRLREWIDADREGLRIQRRIGDAARAWQDADRDAGALLRGGLLAIARDWAAEPGRAGMPSAAREYLSASVANEQAERATERRRIGRLRVLAAALTVVVLVAVTLAGYALVQRHAAASAQDGADHRALLADSRELALEASQLRDQDVSLAAQLSLAAYRTARTPAAAAALLESSGTPAAARLIDTTSVVEGTALSPDRRVLAVAASDGTLRLWNVAAPGHPAPIGHPLLGLNRQQPLYAVAFSPDGDLLAVAGQDAVVRLWNVRDPARPVPVGQPLTGPTSTIYSLSFSPDGRLLAAGSWDHTVRLWALAGDEPVRSRPIATLTGPAGSVQAVAFSPDSRLLAAGSADQTVRLWNVADPRRPVPVGSPLRGPSQMVTSVAFSPDGQELAAGSRDNRVWLWRIATPGRPVRLPPLVGATDWVNTVAFSPNGAELAAGSSDDSVRVWDLATGRLLATLPLAGVVTSVTWPDPGLLLSGDADGTVRLWSLPGPVLAAAGSVNSVAFRPGGGQLAVGSTDLELWNPHTRAEIVSAPAPGVADIANAVAYAPGGDVLSVGYGNGSVQLWDTAGNRLVPFGPSLRATTQGMVESVTFSPDGRILATGSDDGSVRLWDVQDPAHPVPLATIPDSRAQVYGVAFSPNGRVLAAASTDDLTRLWDVSTPAHPVLLGRPLGGTTNYDMSVAFSPDGRTLAVSSADSSVQLWDVTNPSRPHLLGPPLTVPNGYVYSVAFSPGSGTLAAGVTSDTVWLWRMSDPARPKLIGTLTGPAGHVYSVAFSPDGSEVAAGSADGTVRLWDTSIAAASREVCATAGQGLTRAEWASFDPGREYDPPCGSR
jgi:WD40 repeat protein/transcriptional regulator with XRE-family HTH domain